MNFSQKKFSNKLFFEFEPERLKFTFKEKGSRNTFQVDYGAIPAEYNEFEERNEWWRNAGLIWVVIGVFQKLIVYLQSGQIKGSFWLGIGLFCLVVYKVARVKFSVLETEKGNVLIIQNKNHDQIFNTIQKKRKEQLLTWYGEINFDNDVDSEIEKFKWLESQGIISKIELDAKNTEISNSNMKPNIETGSNTNIVH